MSGFILGSKSESSQTFTKDGIRIPVTFIKTTPNYLISIKKPTTDSLGAIKIGFMQTRNIKKPVAGEIEKAGIKTPLRFLREFRLDKINVKTQIIEENKKEGIMINDVKIFVGDEIMPTFFFKKGDFVTVSGTAKGKGFQGVVKRHHFAGGPRTHGQSDRERAPGSIGQTTTPGRVYRGKRMAGRMGGQRVTLKNLEVIEIKNDGLLIKGLIAGAKGGLIEVKSSK